MHDEREQLERLKQWIKENALSVLLGLVLGLGGIFGWRLWQDRVTAESAQVSTEIFLLARGLRNENAQRAAAVSARLAAADLKDNLYADMARLLRARTEVEQGSLQTATALLREVSDKGEGSIYAPVAQSMLIRVYIEMSQYDEALALAGNPPPAHEALYAELRGDIHYYQGRLDEARQEYLDALGLAVTAADSAILELKLEGLSIPADDLPESS